MIVNADLHIHSPFSKHSEIENNFKILSTNAEKKGLDFIATGDCLHPQWLKTIATLTPLDEGTLRGYNTSYILSSEVQTDDGVHHLVYFPDLTSLYDFRENLRSVNVDFTKGRPIIPVTSETLAHYALNAMALIGPAHIFDPFTGLYSLYDNLQNCYGSATPHIYFVELGLGIDSYHADFIRELHTVTYITNSDTHNPHPIRLGREFTQFTVKEPRCRYLFEAIKRKNQNKPVLNVGFPPEEGKYYQTGCNKCQKYYTLKTAKRRKWKCTCGGTIKKGIKERIIEQSSTSQYHCPYHRPIYLSLLPLHEIITRALQQQNPFVETVEHCYNNLISTFGDEIHILLETPIENIRASTYASIADLIELFRMATFDYNKGGGGIYGSLKLPDTVESTLKSSKIIKS